MADLEQDLEVDEEIDTSEDTTEEIDSYEDTQEEEITWEKAQEWKKKAERLDKAEKKLVELKKQVKDKPKEDTWDIVTQKDLELRDSVLEFIWTNPELKDYKSDVMKYVKQWFSLKQAKALIESDDKTIINRSKTNSMNISNTEWWPNNTAYTKAELAKMSQKDYEQATNAIAKGKARLS